MTHEPIDGRTWCAEAWPHRWITGHGHFAPCCLHRGHWPVQEPPRHSKHDDWWCECGLPLNGKGEHDV